MSSTARSLVRQLPGTVVDLQAARVLKTDRTLNDYVEEIVVQLWGDPSFKDYLDATDDGDAKEGSLSADNLMAATMIRNYATKNGKVVVAGKKLATIVKALSVVLRRYNISRHERAYTLGGVIEAPAG